MRALLLLLTTVFSLCAAVFEVQYSVSYWFLGRIGTTYLKLETRENHYRIDATAKLEGVAALLARHHIEHHASEGRIGPDGTLIPHHYDANKTLDGYAQYRRYYFEPRQRRILLQERTMWEETSRHFDLHRMRFVSEIHPHEQNRMRLLSFYAANDLLTLYFNAGKRLKSLTVNNMITLKAVGARNGDVKITRQTGPNHFSVTLDQDIFKSKDGKLYVEADEAMYVNYAVLKNVLLFGDLEVKREWMKRSP
jgi:hypothetical protein